MTQFHEGQEVEVWKTVRRPGADYTGQRWCKAKIVAQFTNDRVTNISRYEVRFPDGKRTLFDATHIRKDITERSYDPDGVNQAIRDQLARQDP